MNNIPHLQKYNLFAKGKFSGAGYHEGGKAILSALPISL
jgi:hypothetical protein